MDTAKIKDIRKGQFGDEKPWSDREYFKNAGWNYAELE